MPKARAWTDEQLREAVKLSRNYKEVCRRLGLAPRGGNWWNVKARAEQLGLVTAHLSSNPIDEASLREAVAASISVIDVCTRLHMPADAASHQRVSRTIRRLRISIAHFPRRNSRNMRRGWTDEQLREAIPQARSIAGVLRTLGLVPAGGNYDQVNRRIRALALDVTHFTGMGWNVGGKFRPRPEVPLDEVLVGGRWTNSHSLKLRLIKVGLKPAACELCGWAQRAPDGRVPIELDHANGDHDDNRLENLRILCPNCHSLQPTHRGLNKRSCRR